MKLYLVKCASGDNYIMAETADGILCSNCAPDGCWAGISLYGYDELGNEIDYDALAEQLREATDPDLCAADLSWMDDSCCQSMAEWEAVNNAREYFNQDERYLIGEYGGAS